MLIVSIQLLWLIVNQFLLTQGVASAFIKDLKHNLVISFNSKTFTKDSAILKRKYYNPEDKLLQHSPVREKNLKNTEINRLRNDYI